MKKILYLMAFIVGLNLSIAHAANDFQQIFANNWETIDKQLQSLIGQPEDIVLLALGVPSATYSTKKSKFLEFTTHKYQVIESGVRLEADCRILIEFQDKKVINAITLNNHNYCAMGVMLPSFLMSSK